MTPQQVLDAIERGESETLELKSSLQPPPEFAKLIASFANANGGVILLGVLEPKQIVGVDPQRAEEILTKALKLIRPSVSLASQTVDLNGKSVAIIEVPRSTEPVSAQGAFYFRQGTRLAPLTSKLIETRVKEQRSQPEALAILAETIAGHTKEVESLKSEFSKLNSWPRKIGIAAVGAAVGAILKHAFEVWFA